MDQELSTKQTHKLLKLALLSTFIYSFFLSLPLYNASTYLTKVLNSSALYPVFICSAILVIFFNIYLSKIIKKYHNYKSGVVFITLGMVSTLILAFSNHTHLILLSYIVYTIAAALIFTLLNIFVDEFDTSEGNEGRLRGIFLLLLNFGIIFGAIVSGLIINMFGLKMIWLFTAASLSPMLYIFYKFYRCIPDPRYKHVSLMSGIGSLVRDKNISTIFLCLLYLESFFALMVVYIPIYLLENSNINVVVYSSVIIPIILLPFILLPFTLGRFADEHNAEKELLIIGISVLAISTLIIPFILKASLFIIIALLFISRVGASIIETMSYSYFFKKVNKQNILLISIFSNIRNYALLLTSVCSWIIMYLFKNFAFVLVFFALLSILVLKQLLKIKTI
jgi:MFS family permease